MGLFTSNLAGIQYGGVAGATQPCLDAVVRLIQYGDDIKKVSILSARGTSCLLVTIGGSNRFVAIKSGFAIGYPGEGPRKFSYLLQLLDAHNIEIDEYRVPRSVLNRLDQSALTKSDLEKILDMRPVRPQRFWEYIDDRHFQAHQDGTLWQDLRLVMPFAIIDPRLADLAVSFWDNPGDKIMAGYRRLEDILRKRTGSSEYGAKLFGETLLGDSPMLYWKDLGRGEQIARANLFKDAYAAYRNPRAHKELKNRKQEYLSEFLLLNHLYLLEKDVVDAEI